MQARADISIANLLPAALGGIAAALVLSYFGVAGSLVGAAVGPVVYLLVKELSRPATESALARAGRPRRAGDGSEALAAGPPPPMAARRRPARRRGLAWVLATAAIASVAAIALITVPELIAGRSITGGERSTTFFDGGGGGAAAPAGTTETETVAPDAPADGTTTVEPADEAPVTEAEPAPEDTLPEDTAPAAEPAPEETAPPVEAPAPEAPAQTAPAP
jgi:hypothetical protein